MTIGTSTKRYDTQGIPVSLPFHALHIHHLSATGLPIYEALCQAQHGGKRQKSFILITENMQEGRPTCIRCLRLMASNVALVG